MMAITAQLVLGGHAYDTQTGFIRAARIGQNDAGQLTIELSCEFPGATQTYVVLDGNTSSETHAASLIKSILGITGADYWEELKNKEVTGIFDSSNTAWPLVGIASIDGRQAHVQGWGDLVSLGTYGTLGLSPLVGSKITTVSRLGKTDGMIINDEFIVARRPDTKGIVAGVVGGHGGDVWCVEHTDGTKAVYTTDEISPDAS